MRIRILVTVLATLFGTAASTHAGLINGGFETGDLTGWTTFTTVNGSLPDIGAKVVPFDIDGDGSPSHAATFRVGEAVLQLTGGGGGLFQSVAVGTGELVISAEIAASAPAFGNMRAGLFELLLDGAVVDSHDFGSIDAGSIERSSLLALAEVTGGAHEVRLRVTRPFRESWQTPYQFIDNVSLSGSAVVDFDAFSDAPTEQMPEPGSITLLGLGLLGLARARRRKRPS
jgi:hypothetical protein